MKKDELTECKNCGIEINKWRKGKERVYCGFACAQEAQTDNSTPLVEVKCSECKSSVLLHKYYIRMRETEHKPLFCRKCGELEMKRAREQHVQWIDFNYQMRKRGW